MSRVVVNLCWMVPGVVGGSEEYSTRLLRAVSVAPHDGIEVELAGMSGLSEAHPLLAASYPVVEAPMRGSSRLLRLAAESSWLANRSRGADLVHHFGGHVPARRKAAAVVTIHDIQPLDLPTNFSRSKRAYMSRMLPRTAATARLICVPSTWVAERVVGRLGIDPSKVRVVPSTWDPEQPRPSSDDPAASGPDPLIESLARNRIVLYPATTNLHKNHAVLIEAFAKLIPSHPDLRLVLTGSSGSAHAAVVASLDLHGVRDSVVLAGRVSSSALAALVSRSKVLAFPSRYEGFGLPVLEAMRSATPVVAADATALPEVLGDGGMLVGPDDVGGWADAIETALAGGTEVDRMVAAATARCDNYSPDASARRLIGVWQDALS